MNNEISRKSLLIFFKFFKISRSFGETVFNISLFFIIFNFNWLDFFCPHKEHEQSNQSICQNFKERKRHISMIFISQNIPKLFSQKCQTTKNCKIYKFLTHSTSMKLLKKWYLWVGLLVLFFGICAWPIRWAFTPTFLTQTHLVLLTNEAEARPCGGFVTAVGEVRLFPLKMNLQNVYAFANKNFGTAQPPLDKVAQTVKFWDLGTNPDLQICANAFHGGAKMAGIKHNHVIFVNIETAEKIIGEANFFADMTRSVANTDRHDEQSLAERKSPLSNFGKKIVVKTLLKPWTWPRITQEIGNAVQSGELYISEISPELKPTKSDISAIEWNLGGGKSSRFLERNLDISVRELRPQHWQIKVKAQLDHLGQQDEPLSQLWKGGIEMRWPEAWKMQSEFINIALNPGENWEKEWIFEPHGILEHVGIFAPRGQKWNVDWRLSLFGQKTFEKSNFETHENVGTWNESVRTQRHDFSWKEVSDKTAPFVTLHEWLSLSQLPQKAKNRWSKNLLKSSKQFGVAEIHFSEPVLVTKKLKVSFRDKNFENKKITENPIFDELLLWNGEQTALIGFWQNQAQPNERFALQLEGITDTAGNEISEKEYTIIDRTN